MRCIQRVAVAALFVGSLAAPAAAQNVTQADIQRLQDNVYLADRDVSQLRARDTGRATQLQSELDDLRDEVIYLRVKLRKEQSLARGEYADVRDRIEDLRTRARSESTNASAAPSGSSTSTLNRGSLGSGSTTSSTGTAGRTGTTATPQTGRTTTSGTVEVPSGTELDVRLQNALSTGTAQVEDRFEATTLVDLNVNGRTVIPAGSVMRGVVTAVEPAGRVNRTARMTVSFDQVTISGRAYPIRGTVTQAIEGEGIRGDVGRAGAGAAVGGLLGAVLGGVKGAVLGAVIGGGGTIAATEGKELDLPQGSVLRVRIDSPVQISTAR
jgi:hypothetical protein